MLNKPMRGFTAYEDHLRPNFQWQIPLGIISRLLGQKNDEIAISDIIVTDCIHQWALRNAIRKWTYASVSPKVT